MLVVENSPVAYILVQRMLERAGFESSQAETGQDALRALAAGPALPDALLLNANLLGMSSYEVVACVREVLDETMLPVIMMSSDADAYLIDGLDAGCNDYVNKPPRPDELIARIRTQMRLRRVTKLHAQAGLLQRILPPSIIERINRGEAIADEHRCVTILFTDVIGFTEMSARNDAATVLTFVNAMFDSFDALARKHGIYKVATIGDAYYAVCGQEAAQGADHAVAMLRFATDVLAALPALALPRTMQRASGGLRIRVGMHCGAVQAGVVGSVNPQFTFLGDAVNTASRMESHGFANCVHARARRCSLPARPRRSAPAEARCPPAAAAIHNAAKRGGIRGAADAGRARGRLRAVRAAPD